MTRRYGAGSVFRRSDGRWAGAVLVAGKRHHVSGETRKQAQQRLDDLRASLKAGLVPADRRLTVGQHLTGWLETKRATVRSSTWESYEAHVRIHLAGIAEVPLSSLTPNHVRNLVRERLDDGCAPRTVTYTLTVLRMALKQAVGDGLVARNVALYADAPMVRRHEVRIPTIAEVRKLLAVESPYRRLWTLMVGTGLREGEALGLRWPDVDLTMGTITVNVALRPVPRHARPEAAKWARTGRRLALVAPKTDASRRTIAVPSFVLPRSANRRTPSTTARRTSTTWSSRRRGAPRWTRATCPGSSTVTWKLPAFRRCACMTCAMSRPP